MCDPSLPMPSLPTEDGLPRGDGSNTGRSRAARPRGTLLLALALVLGGCSSSPEENAAALDETRKFHALLGGDAAADTPAPAAWPRVPEGRAANAWVETATEVQSANGAITRTELAFSGSGRVGLDRYIGLIYRTDFANGSGFEYFSLLLHDGQATLVRYAIDPSFEPSWLFQ